MARKAAGAGGMPAGIAVKEVPLAQAQEDAAQGSTANFTQAGETEIDTQAFAAGARAGAPEDGIGVQTESNAAISEIHPEGNAEAAGRQPDFRVVQPEYNSIEGKTIFKDVGALWKNISKKTGREFYTMKIGKLKLLVFPNSKLEQ